MKKLIFILFVLLFATIVYAYDSEFDNLYLTGWLNVTENVTASYFKGDGSELTDLTLEETDPYWTANQSSYSTKAVADTLYAPVNYGDNWNKTYADTLYRLESWNNLTGIPHATPNNGDVTHFSYADEIYDWIIGLGYTSNTGTVTSIATTAPISGGTITSTGTISLATATPSNGDITHASTADQIYDYIVSLNYVANAITSLVSDATPQLGGYLDTNGNNIGSTTDEIEKIYIGTDQEIYFGDGQESYIKGNSTQIAMCGPTFCFIAK